MQVLHRVRSAEPCDIGGIERLLSYYSGMGDLLPRSKIDLEQNLKHFLVIEDDDQIIACGSLEHFTPELAEVRSLMVDNNYQGTGLGRVILQEIIKIARSRDVGRLMALTYVPDFFHKSGFNTVSKEIFPEKIWGICVNCYKFHNCDEIAVLLKL